MPLMNESEISERLQSTSGWQRQGEQIVRLFTFGNFIQAMEFVNQVAEKAEAAGHHPDIDIRYNKVRLALSTHDAGGLTQRDFDLAASVDALLS
ncbi:4a-hydroxytetrahydrobiopterin dehydratase [Paracidobacterium acidisoli]|uniref:Putative pterin-4-alpha-carbinolamine dehydratase n=1 Tax=Paracidobacterium acidisoli TaxID=2303751 RepID=A0A372IPL8_9BACT|nr:4a-hydroxytetrahydrobiopterin dehydratase [Paracidobacterium acidisoli]MBT9330975.1 4a-hydroxytetrahydrobiopterin dehydratase [Paracidobacterium acidisoli]